MNQIAIIQVKTADQIAEVAKLAREIWTEHYTPIIGSAQVEYMLERFQSESAVGSQIQNQGYMYYLASMKGENIGYMGLVPENETGGLFLSKIYLRKAWRGRGYAREALEFAEKVARGIGIQKITLTVNKHNSGSIAAYLKMGFAITGPVVSDIGSGYVMDDFRMVKYL